MFKSLINLEGSITMINFVSEASPKVREHSAFKIHFTGLSMPLQLYRVQPLVYQVLFDTFL
jgi:hypothetical protein